MENNNKNSSPKTISCTPPMDIEGDAAVDYKTVLPKIGDDSVGMRVFCEVAFEGILLHENSVAILVNDQFCEMFGYKREELLESNKIQDLIAPESQAFVRSQIASCALGPYEAIGLRKDGSRFPIEVRVREVFIEGRKVRVVSVTDFSARRALEQKVELATYKERERIEQELHDGVCQNLVASSYLVAKLNSDIKKCNSENVIISEKVLDLLRLSLSEVKNIGKGFNSIPATSSGLYTGLKNLADKMSSFGSAACSFVPEEVVLVPYKKELNEIYMIIRESAINAAKHAEASKIIISLSIRNDLFIVRVKDNGKGINQKAKSNGAGMGMGIMQQRAHKIGAILSITPIPTGGTQVQCTFS